MQYENILKETKNIGGWLILVAVGLVLTPFRIIVESYQLFPPIFQDGTFELLTSPDSEFYHPLWSSVIIGEIAINIFLLVFIVYLLYLFFNNKASFPNSYIFIALFGFVFILVDAFAVGIVFPSEPVFDKETLSELLKSAVGIIIWVPYMLISVRVKETFVVK